MLTTIRSHVGRNVVAYLALGVALGVGGGVAYSAIPDPQGLIHGCYNDATGALRLTDSEDNVPRPCQSGETALDWNQRGPEGPAGPPAPADPTVGALALEAFEPAKPGPLPHKLEQKLSQAPHPESEAYSTFRDGLVEVTAGIPLDIGGWEPQRVARLAVPAGHWVISAKTTTDRLFPEQAYVMCVLRAGADFDLTFLIGAFTTSASQVVHSFSSPGYVEFGCGRSSTDDSVDLFNTKVTAVRVSKLHNKPAAVAGRRSARDRLVRGDEDDSRR